MICTNPVDTPEDEKLKFKIVAPGLNFALQPTLGFCPTHAQVGHSEIQKF
jgi:hypothetical protein